MALAALVIDMPKPSWLVEMERKKAHPKKESPLCKDCLYFGKPIKMVKHKGEEWVETHECQIHEGCFNTKFSICCNDWTPRELV